MRLKGRKLWVRGVAWNVDVEDFRSGDGETFTNGYREREGRRLVVDTLAQDDSTLMHELGHAIAESSNTYLSEFQMIVFEDVFALCRDPRNAWLAEHLFGRPLA
jgi:hypothetical protein